MSKTGTPQEEVFEFIKEQRKAQDAKWGKSHHGAFYWLGILTEELGKVAKTLIEAQPRYKYREKVISVAAVCVAWLEDWSD